MKTYRTRLARGLFAALVGLLLGAAPALAQQGTLTGVLVDAETGEALIGANVVVKGTAIGTATDVDGRYRLQVVAGLHALVFSYIGYVPTTVEEVEVLAGKVKRIDVALQPEAIGIDEVVVEAGALRNAEAALLRERQKAAAVSDAISAEAIGRAGSSTAADAMQMVTGASVVGGKYVYVRGLGDRYLNTQLNGATPSRSTSLPAACSTTSSR